MVSTVVNIDPVAQTADMVLPKGCYVCGGDVHLRLSPGTAHTYCEACHLVSRPKVSWGPDGMGLHYVEAAHA